MDEAHAKEDSPGENRRRWKRAWPKMVLAWLAVVFLFLLITPFSRYLLRAAWEEASILKRRKYITAMMGDTLLPPATLAKLGVVLAARTYADSVLGLDAGKSFTMYSQLSSDTLVLVLSAAYRDKLQFYRWWFPIVGRVPYKGWFNFEEAKRQEARFRNDGFDTELRPASAFSTLGWFNDPLLSTTLRADSLHLANTVIHELTHNEFYAAGQAEFNESFANFVGARGSAEFFRKRGSMGAAAEADARWGDEKVLAGFWRRLYLDVDSVFKAHPGDTASHTRIVLRDSVYRVAKNTLVFKLGPALRTVSPRYLERLELDNATLLAGRIYQTDLALFDSVFVREGSDTRRTIERVIALAKREPKRPYEALRAWLKGSRP
jgi:predicted aminopeptidase